jgi:ATP-dependent Lhr-like helicase
MPARATETEPAREAVNITIDPPSAAAERWFSVRGWRPFDFQREVWAAMAAGRSGLLHATTGSGKTYAVWLGALERARLVDRAAGRSRRQGAGEGGGGLGPPGAVAKGPKVLWLTPMRALAADTERALQQPLADMAPAWRVGMRTGDTPSSERARQERRWPQALVTTPESLSLMLTRECVREELCGVHTVIVDEWHELIGNKRGVQVQLALARLRGWNPQLVVWGLSATLGNLDDAMAALLGQGQGTLVRGHVDKTLVVDTLVPPDPGRFSWAGHLGAQMLQPVIDEIDKASTTLVFTNVRSQAETWYQLILRERPDWAGLVAVHHGSLDKSVREWVELGLKEGRLKAVVATSSLDLGVDFLPVERVLQIGSAKGVARLLQRAGRSGHAPGRVSRITLVPTHNLELVEAAAARRAAQAGRIEKRTAPDKPLDALVQHLVTVALGGGFAAEPACGGGFEAEALWREVRSAYSYRRLTRDEFQWALDFVEKGGASLGAYPEYHRVARVNGVYRVPDRGIARRHRMQVGTIVGETAMRVKWMSGGTLGSIEEGFIARLRPGDCFVFAGRVLEYVRTHEMTAYVRKATKSRGIVPAWSGSKMPLSTELADATLDLIARGRQHDGLEPEMQAAQPMLRTQAQLSRLPTPNTLLAERFQSSEGHHLYLYPFGGRNVHVGVASLLAWRLARTQPNTYSISVNDYGFELLGALPIDLAAMRDGSAFACDDLLRDVLASLNASEMAQRRFREIARVAGLVFTGYPGEGRSARQLQASSSLFYEVFRKYDAGNLLLTQAEAEVLAQELELERMTAVLERMSRLALDVVDLRAPSPFSLPLMVERFREQISTEKLEDRLARMLREAEAALAGEAAEVPAARRRSA